MDPQKLENDIAIMISSYNERTRKWDKSDQALKWHVNPTGQVDEKVVFQSLSENISQETFQRLVDFETHVDDVSKSYENKGLC